MHSTQAVKGACIDHLALRPVYPFKGLVKGDKRIGWFACP
jgi:hypothetical protein